MDIAKALSASLVMLTLIGCGGGSSSVNPTPTPTPVPALSLCGQEGTSCANPTTIAVGASEQFVATASSGTLPALNWSVNGVQGGNPTTGIISATGLFTAPTSFASGKSVMITAAAQSNSSTSGSATAIIVDNSLAQTPPVKLGTSGGNATDLVNNGKTITCCSGTLGSLVSQGGSLFVLSNNHVLGKSDTGAVGDNISQPGLVDSNCSPAKTVATLTQHAALKPTSIITTGPCAGEPAPCGPAPSNVDAAIAQITTGQVDPSGSILDLGSLNGASIGAMPPSATLADPNMVLMTNEGVAKSGRRTGLTCSNLMSISTEVSVQYDGSCGGATAFTATFANQVIINGGNFSMPGDSGSLVVTSDTARPVGLLYGGNSTSTSANPIQDVLGAFSGGSLSVVGGPDHTISCSSVANSASSASPLSFAALSAEERQRVFAVRQKNARLLMRDPAITSVTAGASNDSPGEGALVIQVSGVPRSIIPAVVEGVRTKVMTMQGTGVPQMPVLGGQDLDQAIAAKENHVANLMAQPGIQGVGVGRSDDNPAEPAIVIYVLTGVSHPRIPPTLDGVRTRIVEGDRFRAY
ncbi:MAG TPA: hypothetical protein VIX19_20905 [Terriglobales bacterium]